MHRGISRQRRGRRRYILLMGGGRRFRWRKSRGASRSIVVCALRKRSRSGGARSSGIAASQMPHVQCVFSAMIAPMDVCALRKRSLWRAPLPCDRAGGTHRATSIYPSLCRFCGILPLRRPSSGFRAFHPCRKESLMDLVPLRRK